MRADDQTILLKMRSGYACLGYAQFLPGYCVLFADPEVASLNDLPHPQRAAFLMDMGLLGDAIMAVCKPNRINYGILGNSSPVLHAHLYPRYDWEPDERRTKNVWLYPDEYWSAEEHQYSEARHGEMKARLTETLRGLMEQSY